MATAQTRPTPPPVAVRPRRRIVVIAASVVAVVAVLLIWYWQPLNAYARSGAAYGARIGCSCRYVAGRSLGDCRKDFERRMGLVRLSEDHEARSVTASVPLLASQTATLRDGFGCVLEKYED